MSQISERDATSILTLAVQSCREDDIGHLDSVIRMLEKHFIRMAQSTEDEEEKPTGPEANQQ